MKVRNQHKMNRRQAARDSFDAKLENFGGVMTLDEASIKLGAPDSDYAKMIDDHEIIAIKRGDRYLIPEFQFNGHECIDHLKEIIFLLGSASPEAKCSFFLNPLEVDKGVVRMPWELLRDGCAEKDLEIIKRDASLYMKQIAS